MIGTDQELSAAEWKQRGTTFDTPEGKELDRRWAAVKLRFPKVFVADDLGTEVGAGWWPALISAAEQVTAALDSHPGWTIVTKQLKEKFGGLRWYISYKHVEDPDEYEYERQERREVPEQLREQVSAILEAAEASAAKTCEVCGAPGAIKSGSWMKTLCDEHDAVRKAWKR